MKNRILIISILLLGIFACSNNDDNNNNNDEISNCDLETVISPELYANAPNDFIAINSIEIIEDCLIIDYGASGCSGDTWEIMLVDSGDILESEPLQRNLRVSLNNSELCLAYFTKETTFDISNIQVDGNQVLLNIENYDTQILYEY